MLRKISIENFFSIRDRQTLDFSISKSASDIDNRFATPIEDSEDRFPRVIVVYGANASGKTNLLKSISFLADFARNSVDYSPDQLIPYLSFQSEECLSRPCTIEVEFDAVFEPIDAIRHKYVYELKISTDGRQVLQESLKRYKTSRPSILFSREEQSYKFSQEFKLSKDDPVLSKIRPNASVISTLSKFNHPIALSIYNALNSVRTDVSVIGKHEISTEEFSTQYYKQNPDVLELFKNYVSKLDLGLSDIAIDDNDDRIRARFKHRGLDFWLGYSFQSQGTQNYFKLFPFMIYVLNTGGIAVFDELGSDIHPLLLPEILRLFQDPSSNPLNAQLIMSCHNATLMENLAKEEVFFAEKNEFGATELYGLNDISGVRRDTNIYSKYLNGVFGAVPTMG